LFQSLLLIALLFSTTGARDMSHYRPAAYVYQLEPQPVVAHYVDLPDAESSNVITLDNDILTGISLPPYGTLCVDTPVYGGPDASIYAPLYTLPAGEVVQLREQPRFEPRDWVMIDTARWIPLSALCEW
jgi:hypothetical protein